MNNKKIVSLLLILCFITVFAACGGSARAEEGAENQQNTENNVSESAPSEDKSEQSDEILGPFSKSASLAETVMVDEEGVKITATGLDYTDYSVELELTIENNSGKNLSFYSGSLGYGCNSVNGYMINDGYLNCDVSNGKKANDSISFSYDELMLHGINEIADLEIGFYISDDDFNDTYFAPRQVKTSAFDAHDYSKDCYQETITSRAAMNTYEYELACFSQDPLYDVNGVKLLSSGMMKKQNGETMLLLELENTTENMVYVSTSDIAVNGLIVNSSTWSSDEINPGRRGIIDVELSSILDPAYWEAYGIKEIGSVALSLRQKDSDGNSIADKTPIEVIVPGAKAEYDAAGREVYNNGGLRIAAKTVLEDPSEYSSDLHVLLLAENKSGKTLSIEDVYDSLSVNGFMTDYLCYGQELADGECAVLEIELEESSLEENKITSASDVKEVEVGFEISDESDTIDEPVLTISFE